MSLRSVRVPLMAVFATCAAGWQVMTLRQYYDWQTDAWVAMILVCRFRLEKKSAQIYHRRVDVSPMPR